MRKRSVKRYAGEDESLVELTEVEEPEIETRRLDARPDVEGMKRGIAAGTPTDRPTASELEFKAKEVRMPAKKRKPKPRYSGVVKASELGSQDFSSKATPAKKSEGSGSSKAAMAGLAAAALAGGALGSRRAMKEGSRQDRIEPSMGTRLKYVQEIDPMHTGRPDFTQGPVVRKKGGKVESKKMAGGGMTASKRADGCAQRGKTRGRMV